MFRKCYSWFLKSESKRHVCSAGLDLLVGMVPVGIEEEDQVADLVQEAALASQEGEKNLHFQTFHFLYSSK